MFAELLARLRDQVPALNFVGGAADFGKASETNPPATPAAYALRLAERGGEALTFSRTEQRVEAEIGVVLVVRNLADAQGAAAAAELEPLRASVRAALLGWPAAGCDPLEFSAGGLLAFRDGHVWWQDAYRTRYDIAGA